MQIGYARKLPAIATSARCSITAAATSIPLNLALGEAEAIRLQGGRIFEQSAVTNIRHGEPALIGTANGQVKARFVIVAGNA